jgi:hypothetical protein
MGDMVRRTLPLLLAAVFVLAPSAAAQDVVPLAGTGENIAPVARVKVPTATEVEMAGDWAFVSQDAGEQGAGGLTIINVADPTKPFIQGTWNADMSEISDASYGDVDLSADGNLAVLTNAHCNACAEGRVAWAVLIDVTDKSKPRLVGQILDDDTMDYVHTATLDNKTLYLNPQVAGFYPQPGNEHVTVFDISNPAQPVKKGTITTPAPQLGLAHDTYIDHRPDGKTLMYAASVHKTDVIDVTDPTSPSWLQSVTSEYTISHDVQPNHDRSIIVVDDEGAAGGQLDERVSACGKVGSGAASVDSGSVHFFAANPDGTFANGGLVHLGSFNAPTNVNTGACVAHVFWQAPNENRLTQAYYRTGAFAIDFEDPANPSMLGYFVAEGGANYWSNKPHRGYMFATDQEGHLDILKYTGEGGSRWPATAGPAEIQRSARHGVPYVPIPGTGGQLPQTGQARKAGRFSFTARVKRVPGKAGTRRALTLKFTNARGRLVERVTVRRQAGRRTSVQVRGVAVAGRYRWSLLAGSRRLTRGSLRVRARPGMRLSPGATLEATAK